VGREGGRDVCSQTAKNKEEIRGERKEGRREGGREGRRNILRPKVERQFLNEAVFGLL